LALVTESKSAANNPAARLYEIFNEARAVRRDVQAHAGWAQVFELDAGALGPLMGRFADMHEMTNQTRRLIGSLEDDDPEVHLEHFGEVEKVLSQFTSLANNSMEWSLSPLQATGMHSLKLCASLLRRRMPEPVLAQDTVSELMERCYELLADVDAADDLDDDETRTFLRQQLRKMVDRLMDVRFHGTGPVDALVSETVGALQRRPGVLRRLAQSHVGRNFAVYLATMEFALHMASFGQNLAIAGKPEPSPAVVQIVQVIEGECGETLELPSGSVSDDAPEQKLPPAG